MTNQTDFRNSVSELIQSANDANTGGTTNQKMAKALQDKFAPYSQDNFKITTAVDGHDVLVCLHLFGKILRLFRCENVEGTNQWGIKYSTVCQYDHLLSNITISRRFYTKWLFNESEVFDILCEEFVKPYFKGLVIKYYKHRLEEKE